MHSKPLRLNPDKLKIAKAEFQHMLDLGIIRPSNSLLPSLHMVPKKTNNGWQPCGDYRTLNAATILDRSPTTHIHDISSSSSGVSIIMFVIQRFKYYFLDSTYFEGTIKFPSLKKTSRRQLSASRSNSSNSMVFLSSLRTLKNTDSKQLTKGTSPTHPKDI